MAHDINIPDIVKLEAYETAERARREFDEDIGPDPLEYHEVLPFPVEVLPYPMRSLVEEGARAINCPVDFLGVPLLAMAGAAIGNSRAIRIKNGWVEGSRIYAAIVADPGSKKSPALNLVSTPLNKRQYYLQTEYEDAMKEYNQKLAIYEAELSEWKNKKGRGVKPEKPKEPVMGQVMTTDSTLEALSEILEENPRGIVLHRDELTGWVRSMNQYKGGKGADRQSWLSFWNGSQVIINRKNRKEPLILDNPFVNVVGALPPDVLGELADERGREDGFIHRILFSMPDRVPNKWTDSEVMQSTIDEFERVFDGLWNLKASSTGDGSPTPVIVPFTPSGKSVWVEWINDHYKEQEDPSFPDNLRGPWAKMEGYAARLALILHMCRIASGEVTSEDVDEYSMTGAAALIEYFKSHAKRVYSRLKASPEEKRMMGAVEWIKRQGGKVTARDILRYKVAGVKSASDAKTLLRELESRGAGTLEEGPRKSLIFHLAPVN